MSKPIFVAGIMALGIAWGSFVTASHAQPGRITVLGNETDRQIAQLKYRVSELERKVAGLQKQVTVLHAKKADK